MTFVRSFVPVEIPDYNLLRSFVWVEYQAMTFVRSFVCVEYQIVTPCLHGTVGYDLCEVLSFFLCGKFYLRAGLLQ